MLHAAAVELDGESGAERLVGDDGERVASRELRVEGLGELLAAGDFAGTGQVFDCVGDDRDRGLLIAEGGVDVLGEFAIVAYCPCEACCGEWALNRPDGIVYTASGAEAKAGVTVAVDPDVIPLGSKVYIDGLGWYVAQDTGNFTGKVIDVYFNDHAEAVEFGRRDAVVGIVED